jgi:hypothetical protein
VELPCPPEDIDLDDLHLLNPNSREELKVLLLSLPIGDHNGSSFDRFPRSIKKFLLLPFNDEIELLFFDEFS